MVLKLSSFLIEFLKSLSRAASILLGQSQLLTRHRCRQGNPLYRTLAHSCLSAATDILDLL